MSSVSCSRCEEARDLSRAPRTVSVHYGANLRLRMRILAPWKSIALSVLVSSKAHMYVQCEHAEPCVCARMILIT
jgi:hypothetical protein